MIRSNIRQSPDQTGQVSETGGVNGGLSLRGAFLDFLRLGIIHLAHDFKNHLGTINESAGLMTRDSIEI